MARGVIVGTAGHIDHGKTTLVRALTGVDTDRLPEEQRRGITIELGFAPLELPGVGRAAVVDVPGHEAFVRTMLAGASGIDVALLVVASDEGVMPQTREHLAILSLLGVRAGVVALTKSDLADPEWAALVADDVRATLEGSSLADAPLVPVSAVSGEGIETLRDALAAAASRVGARDDFELFRMPVDRAFTGRGTGTVVTGTVWSGTVARDGGVTAFPGGARLRLRGVQQHGASLPSAEAGSRAALALAGADVEQVPRGTMLVDGHGWAETRVLRATVELLGDAPPLRARSRVRLHLGTADVGARVVTAGGALQGGERKGARLVLDAPVVARGGDRFVLRLASPVVTIGGGVVTDPHPPHRRARPWPAEASDPAVLLAAMLGEAGATGIARPAVPVRLGVSSATAAALVASSGGAVAIADRLFLASAVESAVTALASAVVAFHEQHPLEPGASRQHVRAQVSGAGALVEHALSLAIERGDLAADGALVHVRGWAPRLTAAQRAVEAAVAAALADAGREPPTVGELAATLAANDASLTASLLRGLERAGRVRAVEADRYYDAGALETLQTQLRRELEPGRVYGPAELRDVLGVSRKYLIPLLEYFDRHRLTQRQADGRILSGT